jgi:CheY-like chemotaxis protein
MATIVVLEDNDADWDMLSRRLGRRGYRVVQAADGQ